MNRRLAMTSGPRFLGIQVGRGDRVEGDEISASDLSPRDLVEKIINQTGDRPLVVNMEGASDPQMAGINQKRDLVGGRVVLNFATVEGYGHFSRKAPDWKSCANIEMQEGL